MIETTFLTIHLVHAGASRLPAGLVDALQRHYQDDAFRNVGGLGLNVSVWDATVVDLGESLRLELSETNVVLALLDQETVTGEITAIHALAERILPLGPKSILIPVFIDDVVDQVAFEQQGIRYHSYGDDPEHALARLRGEIAHEVCRMLRAAAVATDHPLAAYLEKVKVFLSHSKREPDGFGEDVARHIRGRLDETVKAASFLDVSDIPNGLSFAQVIEHFAGTCVLLAIQTDTYSSREWCQREILAAKRAGMPIVVANCVRNIDVRSFPYIGNVPTARLGRSVETRWLDAILSLVMEETMKGYLWRRRVALWERGDGTRFLSRPPELFDLGDHLPVRIVHPDPPLGTVEASLFREIAPEVEVLSAKQYQAGIR